MIYFDNAATGGTKPERVIECALNAMRYLNVNAGRSAHRIAVHAEELIYKTRKAVRSFFNSDCNEQVIFTKNCTEALNFAILGLAKNGGHVIASTFEHNSVLRPLYHLEKKGIISLTIIKPNKGNIILKEDVEKALTDNTYMVCLTCASNVTGEINDYEAIGGLLKEKNIIFLVDGAQGAGHLILDMQKQNIDVLCFSAHKGIDGIQGIGCLIFKKGIKINPIIFGGSGSESFAHLPSGYPELLECGTHNLPAICSLYESILYTKENMIEKQHYLIELTAKLISDLKKINGVRLYSTQNPIGIVSFAYKHHFSQEIAGILSEKFDIAVRGGFHCAPLAHEFLDTKTNGLIRVSFSQFNTVSEISEFIFALKNVDKYLYF